MLFKKHPLKDPDFKCKKVPAPDFPVEKGNYLLGNMYSPVAVVIPRTKHDLIKIAIEAGAAIAGRLVTANIGIEKIIANIISNPNIRYVILFGNESDGHMAAQSLLSLHKHGIDKTGKIKGSGGMTPYIRNLPAAAIERFQDQIIYTLDLIGEDDPLLLKKIITVCLQEPKNAVEIELNDEKYLLYDPGAFNSEPVIFQLTEKLRSSGVYETLSPFSTVIHAQSIACAYPLLIESILSAGREICDERGSKTKELLNVQVNILNPSLDTIPAGYRPEGWIRTDEEVSEYLDKYAQTYFQANKTVSYENGKILVKNTEVVYTYGTRLVDFEGINQIDILTKGIRNAIAKGQESRRFVISLINPRTDLSEETESIEIPCFSQFWVYNRKENEKWVLHGTMFLRSHEAYLAFPANSFAGMRILEHLCENTSAQMGTLTMFLGSAHITSIL
ncbi:MAG: thymidylate synthase [Candidatus Methanoperedens sp.]|nr:thymidylate synthase [Candidatus Methanoperedens sp.]